MYIVTKGSASTTLVDRDSAILLLQALSDYNCSESVGMKTVIGREANSDFSVSFDDKDINPATIEDTALITSWLLSLGCAEVLVKRDVRVAND